MLKSATKCHHVGFRVSADEKSLITLAAYLERGQKATFTEFCIDAAVRAAKKVLEQHHGLHPHNQDLSRLMQRLLDTTAHNIEKGL